jgi:hypothetical protein
MRSASAECCGGVWVLPEFALWSELGHRRITPSSEPVIAIPFVAKNLAVALSQLLQFKKCVLDPLIRPLSMPPVERLDPGGVSAP